MLKKFKNKINGDLHLKELLKGSSISFAFKIIGMGFGYIFTILLTRNYGTKVMGIYALSLVVLQVGTIIGRLGMDTAVLRFVAEYNSQNKKDIVNEIYKKIIKLVIPISLAISIAIFFLSPYISHYFFHKNYLSNYFRIIAIGIVPYVLFIINSESLRGLKKIKEYAFLQNMGISFVASIMLGLSLFIVKNNYIPVTIYIISMFLMSLLSFFLWFKKFNLSSNINISEPLKLSLNPDNLSLGNKSHEISYKNILSISTPMLISGSLSFFLGLIDIIILGIFKTSAEVGIYSVAIKLSSIVVLSLLTINTIAAPKFAEFWVKGDKKGLLKIARQSTKIVFWVSFPILLLMVIFSNYILGFFGQGFRMGEIALIMLTLGQFINAISGSVGYILEMTGFQIFTQNIMIASVIINIILNLLLVPKYGIDGAAFASMITLIFWNLTMGAKVSNILGGWIFYKPFYLH
ncbi:MAG: flippase [Candidatus Acididesulfobacter diazotrophicus]|jgi:O-antigen/teichoic acid export membrane protein|uniref:Flippase n=1 Tax=Candidatus Acididesulfobacter diazotrophicus TaxID=2597226 RepID=A0A519BKF4_9DELT|nr:MAG: flippase [Candidatus Acididesulfobacter diazotrophicus]